MLSRGKYSSQIPQCQPMSFQPTYRLQKNVFGQAMDLWINRRDDERPAAGSPAADFFTRNLQRFVEGMVRRFGFSDLTVKASVGVGRWAEIPWVGIRSQEITTNFQDGIFVVYVFATLFRNNGGQRQDY